MGQKRIICFWCQAETNSWTCDHSGDCLCHVFNRREERYSCKKKECKEKQRAWQKSAEELENREKEEEAERQQEKLQKIQEQNENYQNLKKEIEDINADDFTFYEDNELQNFFTDWTQKIVNEEKTWENINSEQAKSLKNLLSEKRKETNRVRKKYEQEEKNLISWDNFLGIIEELKENPTTDFTTLPEWDKLITADKELAKVVQKITQEGKKVKEKLSKANKEYERELAKKHFRQKVDHWLSSYQLDMKHKEISLKDKDLSEIDDLVAEICDERGPNSPEPSKKNSPATNEKEQLPPPTQHDINKKYHNDTQKEEVNNRNNWQSNQEQQLAEQLLKKIIAAELCLERGQPNPQIVSELLKLKKDHPAIYKLLNKEGRIDKVIANLQDLAQQGQENNSQPNGNSLLLPSLIIGGIVILLIGVVVLVRIKKKKKKTFLKISRNIKTI